MRSSRRGESEPLEPLRTVGDQLVERWCRLDRGWQAVLLGLGIVATQLLLQAV